MEWKKLSEVTQVGLTGREVLRTKSSMLDFSDLSLRVYMVRLTSTDNEEKVFHIIKK